MFHNPFIIRIKKPWLHYICNQFRDVKLDVPNNFHNILLLIVKLTFFLIKDFNLDFRSLLMIAILGIKTT